jgi:CubicO group peptidase (beta-lactamase class C family)
MSNPSSGVVDDPEGTATRLAAFPNLVGVQVATATAAGIRTASAGPADVDRPDALVTAETIFRPGSITKLLTATMVMQCVDDGLVSLDDPVTKHVPGFRLAAPGDADRVTVAHLLAHASGIDAGDVFVDTGDGDDALARYVELLHDAGLLFEPGRWMSYCNGGFVLAGHLVALLRGQTWEEVAQQRVFDPLGMTATAFVTGKDAEGCGARGHLAGPGGVLGVPPGTLADDPMCTRGLAPAGGTLSSTAADLARFAAAHLGVQDGPPILSAASAGEMRRLWARAPGGVTKMAGMGLGWQVWRGETSDAPLRPRIGGANPGQSGLIAVDQESAAALVVLTNTDQGVNAVNLLLDGFGPAAVPDDEPPPADLDSYAGRYRSQAMTMEVGADDSGGLRAVVVGITEARIGAMRMPGVVGDLTYSLTPIDRTTFATPIGPIAFIDRGDDGRPQVLRWRMRAHRRITSS